VARSTQAIRENETSVRASTEAIGANERAVTRITKAIVENERGVMASTEAILRNQQSLSGVTAIIGRFSPEHRDFTKLITVVIVAAAVAYGGLLSLLIVNVRILKALRRIQASSRP
jgi:predicted RNase H-related nuclease YkuK (DUF458 family)